MPVQDLFSFNDLAAVNSSPQAVKSYFSNAYGEAPDGICVNSETYYNAVSPAATEQYGHACYKVVGPFSYQEVDNKPPTSAIVGSNYAINNSSQEAEMQVSITGEWSEETNYSSSITEGLTISSEFTIEGVFKTGASFSVQTTAGKSDTNGVQKSSSSSVTVKVPANSKIMVSMVGTLQVESMNFQAPITVQGMFGANFPDRVQGHYIWFADAGSVLQATSGEITGTVTNTSVFNVQTTIGAAEPI